MWSAYQYEGYSETNAITKHASEYVILTNKLVERLMFQTICVPNSICHKTCPKAQYVVSLADLC